MDCIFIDTSVFVENNFLEGRKIKELLRLSEEGHIKLVLPEIISDEILNKLQRSVVEALNAINKKTVLKNIDTLSAFVSIDKNEYTGYLAEKLEKQLEKSKVEIIKYHVIDIKPIFNSYFESRHPFGSKDKKHEFPDAFALAILEEWCKEKKRKCIVFTNDKDIKEYKSENIYYEEYNDYLDKKLREIEKRKERLSRIDSLFSDCKIHFVEEIKNWIESELDDESTYARYTNYLDIHEINILKIKTKLGDYKITSISDDEILLECDAQIYYKVEIEYDDMDDAIYDDEEKIWHYFSTVTKTINNSDVMKIIIIYRIPIAGEQFADLTIKDINEGNGIEVR